jgi:LPXTG-site transpeptidase (sortase) family protein
MRKQVNPKKGNRALVWINRLLLVAILGINIYILAAPFWPEVSYIAQKITSEPIKEDEFASIDRSNNRLIIPSIGIDDIIHDGKGPEELNKGIWHRPQTSTPDIGSNTVLVGHRWLYNDPEAAVFYHLPKVSIDQKMVAVWDKQVYVYKITDIKEVDPTEISVEDATKNNQLTVYTCTPLWTASKRLIVTGELEKTL